MGLPSPPTRFPCNSASLVVWVALPAGMPVLGFDGLAQRSRLGQFAASVEDIAEGAGRSVFRGAAEIPMRKFLVPAFLDPLTIFGEAPRNFRTRSAEETEHRQTRSPAGSRTARRNPEPSHPSVRKCRFVRRRDRLSRITPSAPLHSPIASRCMRCFGAPWRTASAAVGL